MARPILHPLTEEQWARIDEQRRQSITWKVIAAEMGIEGDRLRNMAEYRRKKQRKGRPVETAAPGSRGKRQAPAVPKKPRHPLPSIVLADKVAAIMLANGASLAQIDRALGRPPRISIEDAFGNDPRSPGRKTGE